MKTTIADYIILSSKDITDAISKCENFGRLHNTEKFVLEYKLDDGSSLSIDIKTKLIETK